MVNRSAASKVSRNTLLRVEQDSYFWETPVGFIKLYRSGNEETKNVQKDSKIQAAGAFQQ
jgi:hypothetical protein